MSAALARDEIYIITLSCNITRNILILLRAKAADIILLFESYEKLCNLFIVFDYIIEYDRKLKSLFSFESRENVHYQEIYALLCSIW